MSGLWVRVSAGRSGRAATRATLQGVRSSGAVRWAGAATVAALAIALGVVSPAVAVDYSPVGEITGVFDDPSIQGPDGHVGGLRVTGWVTDEDRGDIGTELRSTVGGVTYYDVAGWESSEADFEIRLPVDPGMYTGPSRSVLDALLASDKIEIFIHIPRAP